MIRLEAWYLFGLAAIALIVLRLRPTGRSNWRDPVAISFSLGLFLAASGTLSKQPVIANLVDAAFGPNAAWLQADILFLLGLCAGTYWVDLMRTPTLRKRGWSLLYRRRTAALLAVIGWMILAAWLAAPTWAILERGGLDVGGSPILLTARLAYLGYVLWGLGYLSYHFYRQRQHMRDRFNYIRLTIPWFAISLALTAPALQLIGLVAFYLNPAWLPQVWPALWLEISLIQGAVAVLIVATFFPPAYRLVSWADKQLLVRRLLRARRVMAHSRPDLALGVERPGPGSLARDPDRWLATLVNEMEIAKRLMGQTTYEIEAPAGGLMPDEARYALREEQGQFLRGLTKREPLAAPRVTGDTYALARWYAAVGSHL